MHKWPSCHSLQTNQLIDLTSTRACFFYPTTSCYPIITKSNLFFAFITTFLFSLS